MENTIRVVEIGGTQVRLADVMIGENIEVANFKTMLSRDLVPDRLTSQIIEFTKTRGLDKCQAIIYPVAGTVKDHHFVEIFPNLPGSPKNVDLGNIVQKALNKPTYVANDMEAAVTGMGYLLKKEKDFSSPFWGLTWSSGIGGRFWDGKKIVAESEVGHIIIDISENAPVCGCGVRGHAESYLGGKMMAKKLKEKYSPEIAKFPGKSSFEVLHEAYKKGEKWAEEYYSEITKIMGIFLANINQVNFAEVVCFKGTVALNVLPLPKIKERILEQVKKSVISPKFSINEIILSPDSDHDSLIGSALIAIDLMKST